MKTLKDTLEALEPNARKLVEFVTSKSVEMFDANKSVDAGIFTVNVDGKLEICDQFSINDDTRAAVWAGLRAVRSHYRICGFVSEVWMVQAKNKEDIMSVRPSDHKDKTEHVMFQLWIGSRMITFVSKISRNPDRMEEWKVFFDSFFAGISDKRKASLGGAMIEGEVHNAEAN